MGRAARSPPSVQAGFDYAANLGLTHGCFIDQFWPFFVWDGRFIPLPGVLRQPLVVIKDICLLGVVSVPEPAISRRASPRQTPWTKGGASSGLPVTRPAARPFYFK
jgi:hypothetical protein